VAAICKPIEKHFDHRIARHCGRGFELLAHEGGSLIARVNLPAPESAAAADK
jgi:hypothetical protein